MIEFSIKKYASFTKSKKELSDDEIMTLVNKYTTTPYTRDKVFIADIVICDNEVDRDTEKFDDQALQSIAKLCVGKTVISDHWWLSKMQVARIIDATVQDVNKNNSQAEPYKQVIAKIYIPKIDKTKELIESIESGLTKEVSVGFSCDLKCSICNGNMFACEHYKGREYNGAKAFGIMTNIKDFYELSFVAVPAQPAAGVATAKEFESQKPEEDKTEELKQAELARIKELELKLRLY